VGMDVFVGCENATLSKPQGLAFVNVLAAVLAR